MARSGSGPQTDCIGSDGKQFLRWVPPTGEPTTLRYIENLFGARNGDLYIGSQGGLSRISHGEYFKYPKLMEEPGPFRDDRTGRVWLGKVGHHSDASAFCSIGRKLLQCHGTRDGVRCWSDFGLAVGEDAEVWMGGYGGICRWRPDGPGRAYPIGGAAAPVTALAFDTHGVLWASVASGAANTGLWTFAGGAWKRFSAPRFDGRRLNIWKLLADRRGSLWVGTHGQGLYRLADGRTDHFKQADGLTADSVSDCQSASKRNPLSARKRDPL